MAQVTKIEWCDVSWNPVHGCSRVSTGCKNCYAETLSLRRGMTPKPWTALNAAENVLLKPHKLREPLSKAGPWKNPCRVFVNSMSDLFHEQIPFTYIAQVFDVMARAPQHTFQILTKRPERMREWVLAVEEERPPGNTSPWPLPNVWLGVSIENRKWVGRADVLRDTPAAVRFISAEPLLGPLIMPPGGNEVIAAWRCTLCGGSGSLPVYARDGMTAHERRREGKAPDDVCGGRACNLCHAAGTLPQLDLTGIAWLIVGGESGSGHRPFDPQWARDLRDACLCTYCGGAACGPGDECPECAGVAWRTAFFLKQVGGSRPGTALEDLPPDLRIREFPETARR